MLLEVSGPLASFETCQAETWEGGQFYIWILSIYFGWAGRTFAVTIVDTTPWVHVGINPFIASHSVDKRISYRTHENEQLKKSKSCEDGVPSLMHPCFTQFEGRVE